jgi:hypothetical protein
MGRTLSERIADRAKGKPPSKGSRNRASFLAIRVDVKQALEDGWTVKAIWETLQAEGATVLTYMTFNRYVNRLVRGTDLARKKNEAPHSGAAEPAKAGSASLNAKRRASPSVTPPSPLSGFMVQPTPRKEDLF